MIMMSELIQIYCIWFVSHVCCHMTLLLSLVSCKVCTEDTLVELVYDTTVVYDTAYSQMYYMTTMSGIMSLL